MRENFVGNFRLYEYWDRVWIILEVGIGWVFFEFFARRSRSDEEYQNGLGWDGMGWALFLGFVRRLESDEEYQNEIGLAWFNDGK